LLLSLLVAVPTLGVATSTVADAVVVACPKGSAFGSMNHIMSSCTTSDDALMKWTLAKRKMIIHQYDTPRGTAHTHVALLSDVCTDENDVMPTPEECSDEYDDIEVSFPFSSAASSSSLALGRNFSRFW
jgi:hypothetical protein